MKLIPALFKGTAVAALLAVAVGCASTTKQTENQLALAGFKPVVASTAKQLQQLKALPPDKLTSVQRGGKIYYVFPDTAHNCVYVGSPKEYRSYQQIHSDLQLSKTQFENANLSQDSPNSYDDWVGWDVVMWSE
jgi:hypothetical protein